MPPRGFSRHSEGSSDRSMPTPPRGSKRDGMEREVDRLLAGLAALGRPAEGDRGAPGQAPVSRAGTRLRPQVASPSGRAPTRADLVALWARVLLGIAFGALMTQWPYPHGCGPLLFVYLGA